MRTHFNPSTTLPLRKLTCLLAIPFSFAVAKAQNHPTGTFVLHGKIGNLDAPAKAYLYSVDMEFKDSAIIHQGNFTFQGPISEPRIFRLGILSPGTAPEGRRIALDDDSFYLYSPTNSLSDARFEHSRLNDDLSRYFDQLSLADSLNQALLELRTKIIQKMPSDQETGNILYGYQTLYFKVQSRLQRIYIANNPDSYFSLMALIQLIQLQPAGTVDSSLTNAYDRLSDRVKNTSQGIKFFKTIASEASLINTTAPDFSLRDIDGKTITLSDLRGKYVLLDFWASWCAPCRAETPVLQQAFQRMPKDKFALLSVSIDADQEKWLSAIHEDKTEAWLHAWDAPTATGQTVKSLYHVKSIPMNFLIDPAGKVINCALRGNELLEQLDKLPISR